MCVSCVVKWMVLRQLRTDLANPVRVEDAEPLESSADALLGDGLQVPLRLLLLHRAGALGLAVRAALGDGALAAAAAHGDAVDDEPWKGRPTSFKTLLNSE